MRRLVAMAAFMLAAAMAAPAMADGFTRFEAELKPKLDGLSYGSGKALGESGFVLNDATLMLPDSRGGPTTKATAKRVTVEDFDFAHATANDGPHFLKLRVEGMKAEGGVG